MMTPAGALTTLIQFDNNIYNGNYPTKELIQASDGNFYGTTGYSSTGIGGTIFKISTNGTPGGTTFTSLLEFDGVTILGASPNALIEGTDGNFYGTTFAGGVGDDTGTAFMMTPAGALTTLLEFDGSFPQGYYPNSTLVKSGDGSFYGTTKEGGLRIKGDTTGTVYKITPAGVLTTLAVMGSSQGVSPDSPLVQGTDGNFYGTTSEGGAYNNGTFYRITPFRGFTMLHSFGKPNSGIDPPAEPHGALVQGADGSFYGTTTYGGLSGNGTVYKVTTSGVVTPLVDFDGTKIKGSNPYAGLVLGPDGNFYGTTEYGGKEDKGTIFRMTPAGVVKTLVTFLGKGANPEGEMILGSDGNFYGTTVYGGWADAGAIFKMTPAGEMTILVQFADGQGNQGSSPVASLTQGDDGNFYGTTTYGGKDGYGTIFKMTPAGLLTTLVQFTGTAGTKKGYFPLGKLLQGADGNFYGTTENGGNSAYDSGVLFKMTPSGDYSVITILTKSPDPRGVNPQAGLIKGSDGSFYGTMAGGGIGGAGVIYRIRFGPSPKTDFPTAVTQTGVQLNGRVNPRDLSTDVSFEYGTSPTLAGAALVFVGTLPAGSTLVPRSSSITGLTPNTRYYFRILAQDADNPVPQRGLIRAFKTMP